MNNTIKFTAFIFAFMLVGAGCLGGDKAADTKTEPEVEVTQKDSVVIKDVIEDKETSEDATDAAEDATFKMVTDPKPATSFDIDDQLAGLTVTESQILKLDIDDDGSLEYAIISTEDEKVFDAPHTFQFLRVYKWNGEVWKLIHKDFLDRANGWFNEYEVTQIKGDNHVLYLEKANGEGTIEEYHFGQLPDGSFGKL